MADAAHLGQDPAEAEFLTEIERLKAEGKAEDVTQDIDGLLGAYQALRWRIFPIKAREKTPLTPNGFKDATDDWATIEKWREQYPDCNWGLATGASELFVVDLDGPEGKESWKKLITEHGHVPTLTCQTGGGGFHFYYHDSLYVGLKNSTSKLAPKVDTRGRGGYVLIPPSIHPNGTPYEWFTHPVSGDTWIYVTDGTPPATPQWIIDALTYEAPAPERPAQSAPQGEWSGRLDGLRRSVAGAPEGQRNHVYNWAVFTGATDAGIPLEFLEILKDEARAAGLGEREIEATWQSATARAGRAA